jgi:UDP-N-acetylmuramyl pentapeptide phosphotransferase/UDP-N-acetylglucosamine-1-phosphate transferase
MYLFAAMVLLASLAGTGIVLYFLRRHAILDHPNARSSHDLPTPRGGGIAVIAVILAAWGYLAAPGLDLALVIVLAGGFGLGAVSWVDDLRSLPPLTRLVAQFAAVVPAAWSLPGPVFQGWLPAPLDMTAAILVWMWFINLFNFMDGIDGISGVEAGFVGGGCALIAWIVPAAVQQPALGIAIAAASIGFLPWNWHKAKIFLGDVGSVPLGFLLGWLLLNLAATGLWAPALILPLYYLADATITLGRRGIRGERVWQAHREHFYQKAVQGGRSHAAVSTAIGLANLVLAGLAILALTWPWLGLAAAAATVAVLLVWLSRQGKPAR